MAHMAGEGTGPLELENVPLSPKPRGGPSPSAMEPNPMSPHHMRQSPQNQRFRQPTPPHLVAASPTSILDALSPELSMSPPPYVRRSPSATLPQLGGAAWPGFFPSSGQVSWCCALAIDSVLGHFRADNRMNIEPA